MPGWSDARLLPVCSLLMLAGPLAQAAVPPDAAQRMSAAFAAAQTLARQESARGVAPRLDNPGDRAVLEPLWNAPALLGRPPYTAADAPVLLGIISTQLQVIRFYANFSAEPGKPADVARNTFLFQDEITRSFAMVAQAAAASLAALTDLAARVTAEQLDKARPGVAQVRAATLQFAGSWAGAVNDPRLHPDNRERLVASMAAAGPALASGLPLPQRATMRRTLQPAIDGLLPAQRASMAATVAAMAGQQCDGFCRVP